MPRPVRDGEINLHHPTSMFPLSRHLCEAFLGRLVSRQSQLSVGENDLTLPSGWTSVTETLRLYMDQSSLRSAHSRVERPKKRTFNVISNRWNRVQWTALTAFISVKQSTRHHASIWFYFVSYVLKIEVKNKCPSANQKGLTNASSPWWNLYEGHVLPPWGNATSFSFKEKEDFRMQR